MDFPLVNGKAHDFSAIETSMPLAGIWRECTEITYKDSVSRGELRADVPWVIASTRGDYSSECNAVFSKQYHTFLIQKLAEIGAPDGLGPYEVEFPLTVVTKTNGMPAIRDLIKKCHLIGSEGGGSRSTDPLIVTVPIFCHAIYWNGVKPYADMPF